MIILAILAIGMIFVLALFIPRTVVGGFLLYLFAGYSPLALPLLIIVMIAGFLIDIGIV